MVRFLPENLRPLLSAGMGADARRRGAAVNGRYCDREFSAIQARLFWGSGQGKEWGRRSSPSRQIPIIDLLPGETDGVD